MNLERKHYIIGILLLAGAFALGRYMTPEKIKIETKTVYQEKTDKSKEEELNKNVNKDKNTVTTKTELTKPDGTKIVKTVTKEAETTSKTTNKTTLTKEQSEKMLTEETEELVEMGRNRVTISALGGVDFKNLTDKPVLGCHVSKPILGPITIGAWGLSSAVGGMSLGLQF